MKILHLSFHYGCISDIHSVFTKLGHQVTFHFLKGELPYSISESVANDYWKRNQAYFNTFDAIITTDTLALSYPFLLNLGDVKPFLIILNCNRFNYGMNYEQKFNTLLQEVQSNVNYLNKVMYIPYTDFERIWCARHNIFLYERAVMPIGKYIQHINDKDYMLDNFKNRDTKYRIDSIENTVFLQKYHNHVHFMDLHGFLGQNNVSVDFGSYADIKELKPYKAIVVLPDAFSKYFTFESIQEEMVILLPSPRFLLDLVRRPGYFFNIEGSGGQLTLEFINLCEWYKYPETRIYFNSFEEMIDIIKNLSSDKILQIKKWCQFYGKTIEEEHLLQWKHLLDKVMIYKNIMT